MFKSMLKGSVVALALTCALPVSAGFVHQDLTTAGDSKVTFHEETGLNWMKLSVTSGMSIDQVSAQFGDGGQFDGWRLATDNEVEAMLKAMMPTLYFTDNKTGGPVYSGGGVAPFALNWMKWMGTTLYGTSNYSYGLYYQEGTSTILMTGVTQGSNLSQNKIYDDYYSATYRSSWASADYGIFMVKAGSLNPEPNEPPGNVEDVPVSSGGAIIGLGLMAMAGLRRRKPQ